MLKKLLSATLIACLSSAAVMAQSSVMFLNQLLDPIPGKSIELENGVKAHNAKFHASGEDKASLFSILTGPHSGQYAWVQGPMTYASMDKPLSKEHTMDWDKNVGVNCRNIGEMRIMKRDEATTYNPANEEMAENYLARVFYGISDAGQLLEAMGMVQKIYVANKLTKARRIYTSEFRTRDGEGVTVIYPFTSFTEFEKFKGLPFEDLGKEMTKVHGADGMKKFQDLIDKSATGWYDEVRTLVK